MDLKITLGSKDGRTGIAYTIIFITIIAITASLIAYDTGLKALYILIGLTFIIYFRYMYFLIGKKPILYIEDAILYYKHPLWIKRSFDLHEVIYVKLESSIFLKGAYKGLLVLYILNDEVVNKIILGGDIYNFDLDLLAEKLTRKAKKYNQQTLKFFNKMRDKSSFISLFKYSPISYSILVSLISVYSSVQSYVISQFDFGIRNIISIIIYYLFIVIITVLTKLNKIKNKSYYIIMTFLLVSTLFTTIIQLLIYLIRIY
jgi:hypothetical protein